MDLDSRNLSTTAGPREGVAWYAITMLERSRSESFRGRVIAALAFLSFGCGSVVIPEDGADSGARDVGPRDGGASADTGVSDSGPTEYLVTVSIGGPGTGRVQAGSVPFDCTTATCTARVVAGSRLQITAVPDSGSIFRAWVTGRCSEGGPACELTVLRDEALGVEFARARTLTVSLGGDGAGTVATSDLAVDCPSTCSTEIEDGAVVDLIATPIANVSFGGWGGDCSGTDPNCGLVMDRDRVVVASFDRDRATLSVALAGDGVGTVTSDLGAIECPGICADSYVRGTEVTLTATPDTDVVFAGWTGACTGQQTCTLTLDAAASVTATFNPVLDTVAVSLLGTGSGQVRSDVGAIDCPGTCEHEFPRGTELTLTALSDSTSRFQGWGGACVGMGVCSLRLSADVNVTAEFVRQRSIQVTRVGSGGGHVSSQPAAIDCGSTCAAQLDEGTSVTLTATPDADSYFVEWMGACASATPTCSTTLTTDRNVTARFRARAVQISVGTSHACAVFADGSVRCWGRGSAGQLGYADTEDVGDDAQDDLSSIQVALGGSALHVVTGGTHSCALLVGGAVRCWGDSLHGQLGYGSTGTIGDDEHPAAAGPVSLGANATSLVTALSHTCAILAGGGVRCWGHNFLGQLGLGTSGVGTNVGDNEVPTAAAPVSLGGAVEELACGASHCCARLSSGGVRCWGDNNRGQLGQGDTVRIGDNEQPSSAPLLQLGGTPSSIHAGPEGTHSCAIFPPSNGYRCWGRGTEGQLSTTIAVNIGDNELPSAMPLTGAQYAELCAGTTHSCGRTTSGAVFCWGSNDYGEGTPVLGSSGDLGAPAVDLSCSSQFNCAVLATGGVRCWGRSNYGQLGYGSTQNVGDGMGLSILAAGDVPL